MSEVMWAGFSSSVASWASQSAWRSVSDAEEKVLLPDLEAPFTYSPLVIVIKPGGGFVLSAFLTCIARGKSPHEGKHLFTLVACNLPARLKMSDEATTLAAWLGTLILGFILGYATRSAVSAMRRSRGR